MYLIFLTGDVMIDIHLTMQRAQNESGQAQEWWIINQKEPSIIRKISRKTEAGLEIYVFSDQVSPPSLGFLAGYGYVLILENDIKNKSFQKLKL